MPTLLEKVHYRNAFYVNAYRELVLLNLCLFVVLVALSAWSIYLFRLKPQSIYFATTPEGKLIDDPPVNIASLPDEAVISWAERVVKRVYDFDYLNYRQTLQDLRQYFTQAGYADYLSALKFSTNLEAVKANKQVVSAEVNGKSTITKEGVNAGFYYWVLNMPLIISYENSQGKIFQQMVKATMTVVRASVLDYPQGLSVHQIILEEVAQ